MERTEDTSRPVGYRLQRWRRAGIVLLVSLALGVLHRQVLTGVASFMTIRDPLEPSDLILPLYQDGSTVPFAAADLYRRGYANHVALARTRPSSLQELGLVPPSYQVWRSVLTAEKVPQEAIVEIGSQIKNSRELGLALLAFLGNGRKSRVIVVASSPLSRLSRNDLLRGLARAPVEVRMYPVSPREFNESTWWRSRHGCVTYFDVYFLWLLRSLRE